MLASRKSLAEAKLTPDARSPPPKRIIPNSIHSKGLRGSMQQTPGRRDEGAGQVARPEGRACATQRLGGRRELNSRRRRVPGRGTSGGSSGVGALGAAPTGVSRFRG